MINNQKSYKTLCFERDSILDEIKNYKEQGIQSFSTLGLWNDSDYLSELTYILTRINLEITPYYILETIKLYKRLSPLLPDDIISQISSFLTSEYKIAFNMYKNNIQPLINNIQ